MLQITVCDNSWLIDYGNCRYVPTPEKQVTSGRTHVISRLFSGKKLQGLVDRILPRAFTQSRLLIPAPAPGSDIHKLINILNKGIVMVFYSLIGPVIH